MGLLCLLLLAPSIRWVDEKGDVHAEEVRTVLEESPSEVRLRMPDGADRTVPTARVLDLVRESHERDEERRLLDARLDAAAGLRTDAARKALDGLASSGSEPWIREYAAAARALLAEQAREEDAAARLQKFMDDHPRSRFLSDAVVALGRVRARAHASEIQKATLEVRLAHDKVVELQGPILLRVRSLRDATDLAVRHRAYDYEPFHAGVLEQLAAELGEKDCGAVLLLASERKWALLAVQQYYAEGERAKGRAPHGPLHEVRKLRDEANLDLPELRSDLEREIGDLSLACGDKEGARGAWERARDLAPDPRRREIAEEALKRLAP